MILTLARIAASRRLAYAIGQQQGVFLAGFCAGGIAVVLALATLHVYLYRKG